MPTPQFKSRYDIIGAAAVAKAKNDKAAARAVMDIVQLDKEKYRLGHTLVFFGAGIGAGWRSSARIRSAPSLPGYRLAPVGRLPRCSSGSSRTRSSPSTPAIKRSGRTRWPTSSTPSSPSTKKEFDDTLERVKGKKDVKPGLEQQFAKNNSAVSILEAEIGTLRTFEQDHADRDDQIRTLKEEIAHQGEMIVKPGKEKQYTADSKQKTEEDIQSTEDKANHLSRVKGKVEQALDEAEDALEDAQEED